MKYKRLALINNTLKEGYWQLFQAISAEGKVIGIGSFHMVTKEEARKYKSKGRTICLYGYTEEGISTELNLHIKPNGEVGNISYFFRNRANTTLGTRNKFYYGLNKRNRPTKCELCNHPFHRLEYHHWFNENLNIGIWLCRQCHAFVEYAEKLFSFNINKPIEKYKKLKNNAIEEITNRRRI